MHCAEYKQKYLKGYIELVNNQTERIFGYRRDEIIGRKVETLVPDALKKVHEGHRSSFFREHSVRPMGSGLELYAKKKDGSLFPVEIS
ncbi:MAG TPA: PAS domain-containing protein, partial [Ignavibacteria bacterium]|nr:PAS domain-containing protein [Ignavibacteria bacterium]